MVKQSDTSARWKALLRWYDGKTSWRAVWIVTAVPPVFTVETLPGSYNVAHRLLAAASRRGRTGWVEEVTY